MIATANTMILVLQAIEVESDKKATFRQIIQTSQNVAVAVSPEVDSKTASVKLMLLSGNIKNGMDPSAKITQKAQQLRSLHAA